MSKPPLTEAERVIARDKAIAGRIVEQLECSVGAVDYVRAGIQHLRADLASHEFVQREAEPRPSDAKKKIKQVAIHARKLAASIEAINPSWRSILSLTFFEHSEAGVIRPYPDLDRKAELRMSTWLSDLARLAGIAEVVQGASYARRKPKEVCAFTARSIMLTIAPTIKPAKGEYSKFYRVAELLWEAISGEEAETVSMKKACDGCLDMCSEIERIGLEEYAFREMTCKQ